MAFNIVSKNRRTDVSNTKSRFKVVIVKGILNYTDPSGHEATFTYKDSAGVDGVRTLNVDYKTISIIGDKFCYCIDNLNNDGLLIKYIPENRFEKHPYNCFKYKDGIEIEAGIKNDVAYVIKPKKIIRRKESND